MKHNNSVEFKQGTLRFHPDSADRVLKFRVFKEGDRWVIGKMVHGSMGTIFDIVDDCRTEKFAQARCDALNAGIVTV